MSDERDNDDERDYEIGFGKPPKKTQFQKGASGNPSGRRKGARSFKTLVLEALRELITVKDNGKSRQISKGQAAAIQLVNKAAMGDLRCVKYIVEQIAPLEAKEEQAAVMVQNGQTSRERIAKKLDAIAARYRAEQGLPPDDSETSS